MTLKKEFICREIMGEYVLVPVGSADTKFYGLITLNETGAFLWGKLPEAADENALTALLLDEYDVTKEQASVDVHEFIETLRLNEII